MQGAQRQKVEEESQEKQKIIVEDFYKKKLKRLMEK